MLSDTYNQVMDDVRKTLLICLFKFLVPLTWISNFFFIYLARVTNIPNSTTIKTTSSILSLIWENELQRNIKLFIIPAVLKSLVRWFSVLLLCCVVLCCAVVHVLPPVCCYRAHSHHNAHQMYLSASCTWGDRITFTKRSKIVVHCTE